MNPYNISVREIVNNVLSVSKWTGVNKLTTASELKDYEMSGAQNIQLVEDGFPDKRYGYERVFETSLGSTGINGTYDSLFSGYKVFAWGTALYKQTGSSAPVSIYSGLTNTSGYFFTMNDNLYYMNGVQYVQIDSSFNVVLTTDRAFIPTTAIGVANATGAGTAFEAVNLLGSARKNSFISDGVAGVKEIFKIIVTFGATSSGNITITANSAALNIAVLTGDTIYDVARKIRNSNPTNWVVTGERDYAIFTATATGTKTDATYTTAQGVTATISTIIQGAATGQMYYLDSQNLDAEECEVTAEGLHKLETTDFVVYRTLGIVVMNTVVPAPAVTGIDNVVIEYYKTLTDVYQVHTLYIQSAATASANVVVLLNGIEYYVAITSGDATTAVATKIRNASYPGWTTGGTSQTVTFTATSYGVKQDAYYEKNTTGATGYMVMTTMGSENYANKILNTTVQPVLFGGDNDTRVFVANKNIRYHSGLYDATYFPDTNYTKIGSEKSIITRFSQLNDTQIIFKKHIEIEPCIWSSRYELDSSNAPYYPVIPINGVASCDAKNCCEIVQNYPTFLDIAMGVHSLTVSNVRDQRIVTRQSDRINPDLLAEANLANAVSFVWGYRYGVAVNGNVYVWDYRLDAWYGTWTNINASCFFSIEGDLYFGDSAKGLLYKFTPQYNDDDLPIDAWFTTKFFSFAQLIKKKLLSRLYVDTKSTSNITVDLSFRTDKTSAWKTLPQIIARFFSYDSFDYSKFTYAANPGFPKAHMRKFREKNAVWAQFKFSNSYLGEGMPIVATQYEYSADSEQGLVKDN